MSGVEETAKDAEQSVNTDTPEAPEVKESAEPAVLQDTPAPGPTEVAPDEDVAPADSDAAELEDDEEGGGGDEDGDEQADELNAPAMSVPCIEELYANFAAGQGGDPARMGA